jgi:hypothetical protein
VVVELNNIGYKHQIALCNIIDLSEVCLNSLLLMRKFIMCMINIKTAS